MSIDAATSVVFVRSSYNASPPIEDVLGGTASIFHGHRGDDVRRIQRAINRAGIEPRIAEDGRFGPETLEAVGWFQTQRGLFATGTIERTTLAALELEAPREDAPRARARAVRDVGSLPETAVSLNAPERHTERRDLTAEEIAACSTPGERLVLAAELNLGYDSQTNSPEVCERGRRACAWAVNSMFVAAGLTPIAGRTGIPGASLAHSSERLEDLVREGRATRIEVTSATEELPPGAIICTSDNGKGHIGIVGRDGRRIYSNASRRGQWESNYDAPAEWISMFNTRDPQPSGGRGRGLDAPTYAYVLL